MSGDRIGYTYTLTPIINFLIFCLIDIKLQLRCHGFHQHFCSFTHALSLVPCASFSPSPSLFLFFSVPQSFPPLSLCQIYPFPFTYSPLSLFRF